MSDWVLYILAVSTLLSVAGWMAERGARLGGRSTRWVWLLCIITSLLIPAIISSVSVQLPGFAASSNVSANQTIVLRNQTIAALSPNTWVHRVVSTGTLLDWDPVIRKTWIALSALMLSAVIASAIALMRRKRRWYAERFMGVDVYVSDRAGPAVVGLFSPRIVVPRWIIESDSINKASVIAHEQSHLHAGDQRLLTIALCLLIFMPWNLPLWWQLKRLRHAIEVDCDARVLRSGHDASAYGETLIEVGQRQSAFIGAVAAMSESTSFLEQRINIMLHKPRWFHYTGGLLLTALSLGVAAAATQVAPPAATNSTSTASSAGEVKLSAESLTRLTGQFKFTETSLMTITQNGNQLFAQLSGQPSIEIFPKSETSFFYKIVNAQIDFQLDQQNEVTGLTLHQNGHDYFMPRISSADAEQIRNALALKVQSQAPDPRSGPTLRRIIADLQSANPTYKDMSPELADATRQQLPVIRKLLTSLGAVTGVEFRGVGVQGWDIFEVHHEHGMSMAHLILDPNGVVTGMLLAPGP